jgi:hypothetical protein
MALHISDTDTVTLLELSARLCYHPTDLIAEDRTSALGIVKQHP